MIYLDSHCHLNDERLYANRVEVIQNAKKAGVSFLLVIGWDVESSKKAVEIAHEFDGVFAAVGIHPENLDGVNEESLNEIENLAKDEKVIAIGEIGLDYHWFKEEKDHENQKIWFKKQIELANRLGLPVSIHARDASGDLLSFLKENKIDKGGVLHCYSGSPEMLKEFVKLGFYFGFDGPVTYKNAKEPKECVRIFPLDRLLTETDSPYLPPVPHRGETNLPEYVPLIVKEIAELKETGENEVTEIVRKNFENLFAVKLV